MFKIFKIFFLFLFLALSCKGIEIKEVDIKFFPEKYKKIIRNEPYKVNAIDSNIFKPRTLFSLTIFSEESLTEIVYFTINNNSYKFFDNISLNDSELKLFFNKTTNSNCYEIDDYYLIARILLISGKEIGIKPQKINYLSNDFQSLEIKDNCFEYKLCFSYVSSMKMKDTMYSDLRILVLKGSYKSEKISLEILNFEDWVKVIGKEKDWLGKFDIRVN